MFDINMEPTNTDLIESITITNSGPGTDITTKVSYKEPVRKESEGKLDYSEIDWNFIDAVATRMSKNKDKYEPGSFKKMNEKEIEEVKQALFRHIRKILQPIPNDPESESDHLAAIGCNAMILNYHNSK